MIVEGDVTLENVTVEANSCLKVCAAPDGPPVVLKDLTVSNSGYKFAPLTAEQAAAALEEIKIRGYLIEKGDDVDTVTAST